MRYRVKDHLRGCMGGVELGDWHYDIAKQMHRAQPCAKHLESLLGQTSPLRKQLAEEINHRCCSCSCSKAIRFLIFQ